MTIVKLYANDDPAERQDLAEWTADQAEIPTEDTETRAKILEIFERKPLYEVTFEFDTDTGKCISALVEGVKFTPA